LTATLVRLDDVAMRTFRAVMYDGLHNPKSKWTTVNSQHRRQI